MRWMPGATSRWNMRAHGSFDAAMVVASEPEVLPPLAPRPGRPFGVYVHVPWCASRCGYCDFNTYVPGHLRGAAPEGFAATAAAELELGARALADAAPAAETLFFGGGTPTLLDAYQLARVVE